MEARGASGPKAAAEVSVAFSEHVSVTYSSRRRHRQHAGERTTAAQPKVLCLRGREIHEIRILFILCWQTPAGAAALGQHWHHSVVCLVVTWAEVGFLFFF